MESWVGNLQVISKKFCYYWGLKLQSSTETQQRVTGSSFQELLPVGASFLLLSSPFTQNNIKVTNYRHWVSVSGRKQNIQECFVAAFWVPECAQPTAAVFQGRSLFQFISDTFTFHAKA